MSDVSGAISEIADFYEGKEIFITGATGFMGKVLVEKLLRSCPKIGNVYVLIRPKKGTDVKERLDELLNTEVFDSIRKDHPEALNKVIAIPGEMTSPNLGITAENGKILVENVSVVFHSAATVKFDESLKLSLAINVIGTKSLVQFCQKMDKLKAFIYVSTAYCNCDRKDISEILYPPPADPDKIIKLVECMDEDIIDIITPRIIQSRPNTYTFTKALAEHVFMKEIEDIPAAMVRPSIVTAAWKEPFPGWIDYVNGPTGILAAAGKGILRTISYNEEFIADLVPVDMVVNLLITVAWYTATVRSNNISIYNCTSGSLNPIRWKDVAHFFLKSIVKTPFNDVIWYPSGRFTASRFTIMNNFSKVVFHIFPAYILDALSKAAGKKPFMVRLQRNAQKALSVLQYFSMNEWQFSSNNVSKLYTKLNDRDKKTFNFDVKQVNWQNYMDNYIKGIRVFVLKEDPTSLQAARNHFRKMYILHQLTRFMLLVLLWRFVILRNKTARKMCCAIWSLSLRIARMLPIPVIKDK